MNTAIAAIEENINGAAPRNAVFRTRKGWARAMKNFVQPSEVVTVTASAGGMTSGDDRGGNLAGARSDRHGDEGGWQLGPMMRVWLDVVAVVAAGA